MRFASILAVITCVLYLVLGVSAQSGQYPNELEGYRFFAIGKLKRVQLLVSKKDDVKRIFGEKCEKQCDYDADWSVSFEYYEDIWTKESSNNKGDKRTYMLDPKYLGTLRAIDLRPKKSTSFANVSFPASFAKIIASSTSDARSGSVVTVNDSFQDPNGLSYEIFGHSSTAKSYKPGDLVLIRYTIPKEREKSIFVLQK